MNTFKTNNKQKTNWESTKERDRRSILNKERVDLLMAAIMQVCFSSWWKSEDKNQNGFLFSKYESCPAVVLQWPNRSENDNLACLSSRAHSDDVGRLPSRRANILAKPAYIPGGTPNLSLSRDETIIRALWAGPRNIDGNVGTVPETGNLVACKDRLFCGWCKNLKSFGLWITGLELFELEI